LVSSLFEDEHEAQVEHAQRIEQPEQHRDGDAGRSSGSVSAVNCRHSDTPSIEAAS
jgi:hypothetical protein